MSADWERCSDTSEFRLSPLTFDPGATVLTSYRFLTFPESQYSRNVQCDVSVAEGESADFSETRLISEGTHRRRDWTLRDVCCRTKTDEGNRRPSVGSNGEGGGVRHRGVTKDGADRKCLFENYYYSGFHP